MHNNFFSIHEVSDVVFDGYDGYLEWGFISTGIALSLESGAAADIIEYSFNGIDVHGKMEFNTFTANLIFNLRHQSKIYFKRLSGPSPNILVRIETWK